MFLKAEVKIGRDPDNDVIIARPSVSGRHAVLRWTGSGWLLKDLSRFGTIVNGVVLKNATQPVEAGDELTFVEQDEIWILENAAAPGLLLASVEGSKPSIHVDFDDGLRAFPSNDAPVETLMQLHGAWFFESESGQRRALSDGATIELGGHTYVVSVPPSSVETAEPATPAARFSLDTADVEIVVLRGEDEAEVTVRSAGVVRTLRPSRPLYLLAYLAERRIEASEARGGHVDEGWLPTELACSELGVDRTILNVDVHRARETLKGTGLANAANIIERRPSQIRIGLPPERLTVRRG
ncbi:MAG TPA: FHA domain-containing protein [Polyangiaceae bacterium]|jgi:pSer/pThr/pTyr-binding forkhead associated (FHA) protein|nr:FHA domain-containing protein [Polyangiaceae bacterium]